MKKLITIGATSMMLVGIAAIPGSASAAGCKHVADGISDSWEAHYHFTLCSVNVPRMDVDHDGLNTLNEFRAHTNPRLVDTNHNRVSDANEDTDHDGVTNGNEQDEGTNPGDTDTDNDGVTDGNEDSDNDGVDNQDEQNDGTDPGDADTDNDGVSDGNEDTDNDGVSNAVEDDQGNAAQDDGSQGEND